MNEKPFDASIGLRKKFASIVATGDSDGNPVTLTDAYVAVYDRSHIDRQRARINAGRVFRRKSTQLFLQEILENCRDKFIELSPAAQERLDALSCSAESEKVKLQANLEILDRAGLKPPQRVEVGTVGVFGSLSAEDIREEVRNRLEGNKDGSNE